MKLRCTKNSVRLRLRKSDVKVLIENARIKEEVEFPSGQSFQFSLVLEENIGQPTAFFSDNKLIVQLPLEMGRKWLNSEQVGIETYLPVNQGNQLHLLIEKDFPCKDRQDEDKSDTFEELTNNSHC